MKKEIFRQTYIDRIMSMVQDNDLCTKISSGKRAFFYKMILKANSSFDVIRKDSDLSGKRYFTLSTKDKRGTFGTVRDKDGSKKDTCTVLMRELQEIGMIKLISKHNSLIRKAALYQITDLFFTTLFPHKQDVIDLFSLKFTTNPETGTVTVELKKSEEKNEPKTEKEIKVENTLQSLKINFDQSYLDSFTTWTATASVSKISQSMSQVEDFQEQNFWTSESSKSGRIYHSYCNLPKTVRPYTQMSYNGKLWDLKEIDLCSAQAYLLQTILNNQEYSDLITGSTLYPDIYMYLYSKLGTTEIQNKNLDPSNIKSRDDMKKDFFAFLYSSKRHSSCSDYIFEQHNPELYQDILKIRKQFKSEETTLASCLQSKEVDLFYPIYSELSDRAIILHDSLHYINDPETEAEIINRLQSRILELGYPTNYKFNYN